MPNTTVIMQRLQPATSPLAFNLEQIGCVSASEDLKVTSVTLHEPTSGLILTDWGASAAERPAINRGDFSPAKHPLASLGLTKTAWSGH